MILMNSRTSTSLALLTITLLSVNHAYLGGTAEADLSANIYQSKTPAWLDVERFFYPRKTADSPITVSDIIHRLASSWLASLTENLFLPIQQYFMLDFAFFARNKSMHDMGSSLNSSNELSMSYQKYLNAAVSDFKEDSIQYNTIVVVPSRPDLQSKTRRRLSIDIDENYTLIIKDKRFKFVLDIQTQSDDILKKITTGLGVNTKTSDDINQISSSNNANMLWNRRTAHDTTSRYLEGSDDTVTAAVPNEEPTVEEKIARYFAEHRHRRHRNESIDGSRRDYKVYYSIFAGRREYLKIHLKYTDILLHEGLVDEVHIWDFVDVSRCGDRIFIENYVRNTDIPGYLLFKRPLIDNNRNAEVDIQGYMWGSYYDHYKKNKRYRDKDVFVKADDDIVFIDVSKFRKYVENVANRVSGNATLYFPTIVNNDVSFYIQAKRLQSTKLHDYYEKYQKAGVDFEKGMNAFYDVGSQPIDWKAINPFPLSEQNVITPIYQSKAFMKDIHQLFLDNPVRLITLTRSGHTKAPRYVEASRRISINMFSATFDSIRIIFETFLEPNCCNDEGFVGLWPTISGNKHYMDTILTVSHFSFNPQRNGLTDYCVELQSRYNSIAEAALRAYHINRTSDFEKSLGLYGRHPVGEGALVQVTIGRNRRVGGIYYLEECKKRIFQSFNVFATLGHDLKDVIPVESTFLDNFPLGSPIE